MRTISRHALPTVALGTSAQLTVSMAARQQIDHLKVRMPSKNGYVWKERRHVNNVRIETQ
jgi:hypothetical protein